jgi:hypothetical protein
MKQGYPRTTARRRLLLLSLAAVVVRAAPPQADVVTSLFQSLGPSQAASMSQGTTVAIPCRVDATPDQACDGVLLLMRSSSPPKPKPTKVSGGLASHDNDDDDETTERMGDLDVYPVDDLALDGPSSSSNSPRWQRLGASSVVAMTGFSPDVHFLTRLLQTHVEDYRRIHESDGVPRSPPAVQLVHLLAAPLQDNALGGGRPLGVATLVVGRATRGLQWHVWTLDPAGLVRSGRGGVIGKDSLGLSTQRWGEGCMDQSPRRTLVHTLAATTTRDTQEAVATDSSFYEGILLCWRDDGMHVGRIRESDLQACLEEASSVGAE